jgi:hypothetical protein
MIFISCRSGPDQKFALIAHSQNRLYPHEATVAGFRPGLRPHGELEATNTRFDERPIRRKNQMHFGAACGLGYLAG